jgi:hypothetical protein
MTADSITKSPVDGADAERDLAVPGARLGISEVPVVRGIIDVTMVGLLGGGPRLAIRAARVMLQDSYGAGSSARKAPGRSRWQRRPD